MAVTSKEPTVARSGFGPTNQTGNPTRLRKSYNLFQYIIIPSKEKKEIQLRN